MRNADDLGRELAEAREELRQATRAPAPKHKGGEVARFKAARDRCSELERALARSLGDEYAVPIEWPHPWDPGAPLPHVLPSGHVTVLLYLVSEPDPNWDGTYVNVVDPSELQLLAIAQFERCVIHKFGGPNDEVLSGHPLSEKGLTPYAAHTIENSSWIEEQRAINSVHSQYAPERWTGYKHYMLLFHDEMFECIATGVACDRVQGTFADGLGRCVERLLK